MKNRLFILLPLFLAACASKNLTDQAVLEANEGVLLAKFPCESSIMSMAIYPAGTSLESGPFRTSTFKSAGKMRCSHDGSALYFNMPAGEYFIGSLTAFVGTVGDEAYIPEERAYKFSIQPGKTNYIGDVTSKSRAQTYGTHTNLSVGFDVKNNSKATLSKFRQAVPQLAASYPTVVAVAQK